MLSNKILQLFYTIGRAVLLFFFTFSFACTEKTSDQHSVKAAIGQEKMIDMLVEAHIAEGALMKRRNEKDSLHLDAVYYDKIFRKYEVTKEAFLNSYNYYRQHPGTFEKMYQEIIEKLMKMEMDVVQKMNQPDSVQTQPDTSDTINQIRIDTLGKE